MASSLDSFEALGSPVKLGKFGHVTVQIGETNFKRILLGKLFGQFNADVFGAVPSEIVAALVACAFGNIIAVPRGNLDHDFAGLLDNRLAAQA